MLCLSVTFQNKVVERDMELSNEDKLLLHQSDCQALKAKSGSLVLVEFQAPASGLQQSVSILCKAWVYSKLKKGSAVMHKLWMPNVPKSNNNTYRIRVSTPPSGAQVMPCSGLTAVVSSRHSRGHLIDSSSGLESSHSLKHMLSSMLANTALTAGVQLAVTSRSESIQLEIVQLESSAVDKSAVPPSEYTESERRFFMIRSTSTVRLVSSDKGQDASHPSLICGSDRLLPSEDSVLAAVRRVFSGYDEQVRTAIRTISAGLGRDMGAGETNGSGLRRPPRGLLVTGPPGSGKSLLVRTALSALNCRWLQLSHGVLLSSADGGAERELRATYERALSLAPSCIVLDDMDLLCLSRSSPHISDVQKRIVACLLSLMDGVSSSSASTSAPVFFVGTTSRVDDIDAAVRRFGRMDREIEIGAPTVEDRVKILQRVLQLSGTHLTRSDADDSTCDDVATAAIVRAISQQAHGMVASDLVRVVKEAAHLSWKESRCAALDGVATSSAEKDKPMEVLMQALSLTEAAVSPAQLQSTHNRGPIITERSLMLAVKKIKPSALREVAIEVPKVRWSDIGGMDEVKRSLREVVEWPLTKPHIFAALGIAAPRGVLLYGPPGCSKTLMAKALATESSMNFLAVRGPELLSKWLGESEKAVQTLFRRARAASPAIVFFDEIDALASRRGDASSGVSDRVLSQLLTELDGVQGLKNIIVIAATNRPDMLDPALIRPGRIDRKIYVPPPDEASRDQILQLELCRMPVGELSPSDLGMLVRLTEGFSGAEIVAACAEAAMLAIEEGRSTLSLSHLEAAIRAVQPQITAEMLQFYRTVAAQL